MQDESAATTSDDAPSPREDGSDLPPPKTVRGDLLCPGCGYNLHGLRFGSRCPECARTIVDPEKDRGGTYGDQLLQIAPDRRKRFSRGCTIAAACLIVAALTHPVTIIFHPDNRALFAWLDLGLSAGWIAGVLLLAPSWLVERGPMTARLRPYIILGTLALPVVPLITMMQPTMTLNEFAESTAGIMRALAALAAVAAAVVLGWILSEMAEDAELERPSRAIMAFVWITPIASLLLRMMPDDVTWVDLPIVVLVYLLWSVALIAGAYGLLGVRSYIRWSIRYAEQRAARDLRRQSGDSERSFPAPVDRPARPSGTSDEGRGDAADDDVDDDDDDDAIPLA